MTVRPFGGTLRLSLAALAAGVLAAPGPAKEPAPWYTSPPPCACPCPWPAPVRPVMPPADGQPRPPDQRPPDQQPPTEPVSTEQPTEADTGAEQVGATGSEVSALSMQGDVFGTRSATSGGPVLVVGPGRLNGILGTASFIPATATATTPTSFNAIARSGSSQLSVSFPGFQTISVPNVFVSPSETISGPIPQPGSSASFTSSPGTIAQINQALATPLNSQQVAALILAAERSADPTVVRVVSSSATVPGSARFTTTSITSSGTLPSSANTFPTAANGTLSYDALLMDSVQRSLSGSSSVVVSIPNPAGGGVVGLTKISEGNSPLPRDRVIFDYDYFERTPLTANRLDVRRFSPGFEKTFFNQSASVEVRFPFASTLSTDVNVGGITNATGTEFGDINITLKALLFQGRGVYLTSGLGIAVPTASDVHVRSATGSDLIRVNNDAVILTPYVAALFVPNDRLFGQAWLQFGFDANGNPVEVSNSMGGMTTVGRLNAQTLAQIDTQVGYWVYRSAESSTWLRGVAPFVELHFNSTLGKGDVVPAAGFQVGDIGGHIDELNLTAGVLSQVRDNLTVALGVVSPLREQINRSFDYQLGLRVNFFFGPTARSQSAATAVSSF